MYIFSQLVIISTLFYCEYLTAIINIIEAKNQVTHMQMHEGTHYQHEAGSPTLAVMHKT
jgi:hypothetical protein